MDSPERAANLNLANYFTENSAFRQTGNRIIFLINSAIESNPTIFQAPQWNSEWWQSLVWIYEFSFKFSFTVRTSTKHFNKDMFWIIDTLGNLARNFRQAFPGTINEEQIRYMSFIIDERRDLIARFNEFSLKNHSIIAHYLTQITEAYEFGPPISSETLVSLLLLCANYMSPERYPLSRDLSQPLTIPQTLAYLKSIKEELREILPVYLEYLPLIASDVDQFITTLEAIVKG